MDFFSQYHELKEALVAAMGQSHALMHVHAGLAIYVLFQLVWGTRRGSVPALLCVFFFEAFNEVCDRLFYGSWRGGDTLRDVLLTMLWPSVLVATSHLRRWSWNRRARRLREGQMLSAQVAHRAARAAAPSFTA
ncbi:MULTISPECIES: hypothetical protein [unclassified Novosphingobium]|uniref:hypothetical protein n=1 Tax=unclassified Novosphingobium TaxID=2644732 RepID=UPI00086ABF76|nr:MULTISPECIES: hypothetical protein [unclassified Novosphingobium]ODU68667.1 MAG: hypothetical protein ABT11_15635 [Novosphingobium sp. SCN 66-18]QCI93123.1 hypothetical protein FA702_05855 [Novosphingobium sp. EMRT-2]RQW45504.1 hypothetical protein EH199_04390 [Novosphingobium sp. LASN5T]